MIPMEQLLRTIFHDKHVGLGAKMVEFGGWDMPVQYESGIVQEHLSTRKQAGLFDVSHMGRFIVSGANALDFLQHVLTNNAAAIEVEEGQYTMIPNETGGAIDDAYLYRFVEDEYLLVVNAANREKDWKYLMTFKDRFGQMNFEDRTVELAMLSLQGPRAKQILTDIMDSGQLPEPIRNALSTVSIDGLRCRSMAIRSWSRVPDTPVSRSALSFLSNAGMPCRYGISCWKKGRLRLVWEPAIRYGWKPGCRSTDMSWALIRKTQKFRSLPAVWRAWP
jgi:hypothetical protein